MEEVEAVLNDMGFFDEAARELTGKKCALLIAEQKIEWLHKVAAINAQTIVSQSAQINRLRAYLTPIQLDHLDDLEEPPH